MGLRDALRAKGTTITFSVDLPAPKGAAVLQRTDPTVAGLARFVLDGALDKRLPDDQRPARRCGMIATRSVDQMTTALLLRLRTHVTLPGRDGERTHVAEEAKIVAFRGSPNSPRWLDPDEVAQLMTFLPDANVPRDVATNTMAAVLKSVPSLEDELDQVAQDVADQLREAHVTVRTAARGDRVGRLVTHGLDVSPELPADLLGVYVFRPAGGAA